eukprot:XP_001709293.1 Hypothetical protein GL50803_30819 [Giardia lamblia ATCC 50803]
MERHIQVITMATRELAEERAAIQMAVFTEASGSTMCAKAMEPSRRLMDASTKGPGRMTRETAKEFSITRMGPSTRGPLLIIFVKALASASTPMGAFTKDRGIMMLSMVMEARCRAL